MCKKCKSVRAFRTLFHFRLAFARKRFIIVSDASYAEPQIRLARAFFGTHDNPKLSKGGGQAGNTDHPAKRRRTAVRQVPDQALQGNAAAARLQIHTQGARQAQRQAREGKLSADRGRRPHALHPRGIHAGRRGGARADRRLPAHPAVGQRRIRGRKPAHRRQKRGDAGAFRHAGEREHAHRPHPSLPLPQGRIRPARRACVRARALQPHRPQHLRAGHRGEKRGGAARDERNHPRARREKTVSGRRQRTLCGEKRASRLLSRKIGGRKPRRGQG